MSSSSCAIEGIYTAICRNPETAAAGLTPLDVELHAPGFYRHDREELEFLTGQTIDRKVQVVPNGTQGFIPLANPVLGFSMRSFLVTIRIGYFVGDHAPESFEVMSDDDGQILAALARFTLWPICPGVCVNGVVPLGSNLVRVDSTRYIWEVVVQVTVTS